MTNKIMKLLDPNNLDESVFRLLDKDWMLITAGVAGKFNTMTASWGWKIVGSQKTGGNYNYS